MPRRVFLLMLALAVPALPSASVPAGVSAEEYIAGLTSAGEPVFVNGKLVLTFQSTTPVRYVGVRFSHEDFAVLHVYSRKPGWDLVKVVDRNTGEADLVRQPVRGKDLFYLIYEPPLEAGLIRYRIVVDGLWTYDPFNPRRFHDLRDGIWFSVLQVPEGIRRKPMNVEKVDGRLYRFSYTAKPASRVSVVGDFNGWDPFIHELEESPAGKFHTLVRMPPGTRWYSFVVNGVWMGDPTSSVRRRDELGRIVCELRVEEVSPRKRAVSLRHD